MNNTKISRYVHHRPYDFRLRYCQLHRFWLCHDWRTFTSKRESHYDILVQLLLFHRSHHRFSNCSPNSNNDDRLGVADTILIAVFSFLGPDCHCLVSLHFTRAINITRLTRLSFLPESPRYLISKDRDDEAFEILVKYHAEGDRDSVFVRAEMAQIKTTIKLELEHAKLSWADMIRTPGMRRRVLIATLMG